jgi:penicillin amidase
MYTIFVRFFILIMLPIFLILGYFIVTSKFGLPQVKGLISVNGLADDITISRDGSGVVSIKSKHDNEVFFAMGFVHAQDRLWQLELQRRMAQGRLSEVFGQKSVRADAQMRTLGLYRSAQSAWTALSQQAKASLTAYSAGVNAGIKTSDSLPVEFQLFGITPEPWQEIDSLAWSKVFALNLSNNMWSEINQFLTKPYLTDAQASELFPGYPKDAPVTVDNTQIKTVDALVGMLDLKENFQYDLKVGGKFVGSNAWVISGGLTDSGNAIMANDPHLGIQVPSLWYMANLSGDKIKASGMTLVGLPIIIFGRNQNIAWGGTNMMADTQDLYFEQVNSQNAKQYMNNGQWLEFETEKQYIKVRPEFPAILREAVKPVEVLVRKTVRGPVISDVFGLSDQPVTLRWTALDEKDTTYESFFRLNYAKDWSSFRAALSHHVAPTLNFMYSDTEGNIGYLGAGKIPVRIKGKGQTPVIGGASDYQWRGYIPFSELPQSYNPDKGYIISANNKVVGEDYPYHISFDWAPPARAQRIEQLIEYGLKKNKTLSLAYMKEMQRDTVSYGSLELRKLLTSASMITEQQKIAQQYVAQWNGDMAANSQGAAIFYSWARHLRVVLFKDHLSVPFGRFREQDLISSSYLGTTYDQIAAALTPGGAQWCDDRSTDQTESCEWAVHQALDLAIKELSKLAGSDMDDWLWGNVHETVYSHQPFSKVNMLKSFFERRIDSGGGPNTINVANARFIESQGYEQNFGAGFRQIISLSKDSVEHFYMNSTGQSGNVFSEFYDDMIEPFRDVIYFEQQSVKPGTELVLKSSDKPGITKQ